jgi:hypothetical protein
VAYPIVELITADLVETIGQISVLSGYNTTPIVERQKRSGNIPRDQLVVVHQGDPTPEESSHGHSTWLQPYVITCYVIESETSSTPIDQRVNFIRCDVEKAVMADHHRGNLAIDTIIGKPELFDAKDGSFYGVDVHLSVRYRTIRDDPYRQE